MLPDTSLQTSSPKTRAGLLATLYTAQEKFGWLSPEAIQEVADQMNLAPGQVYTTASFYTMFKLQPQGHVRVQVCEGLSCYLVGGAEPVIDYIRKSLGILTGDTSADGKFTLEVVQCLAACDLAPAIMIDDQLYGHLTVEKLGSLLAELMIKA